MFVRLTAVLLLVSLSAFGGLSEKETRFLFFGDFGTGTKDQQEVAAGMRRFCTEGVCQFTVLLGDNFYPSGVSSVSDPQWESKFLRWYQDLPGLFYVSLGNHDYGGNVDAQVQFSGRWPRWKLPARYHRFTEGEIDFFAIDTNQFDLTQRKWLASALGESQARWKIVFGHHPIYSYGMHGNAPGLISNLLPILHEAKVDFYLAGHDHDKQVLTAVDGVNLIVSGTAAQVRPVKKGPLTRFAAASLGFSHFSISAEKAKLKMLKKDGTVEWETEYSRTPRP